VRGASALQDLLTRTPDPALAAFVVWEPVIWSDLAPPLTGVLGRVSDRRAAQIWDRELLVSAEVRRAIGADEDVSVVWDCVAVYPPGTRWDDRLPAPVFIDCPVVEAIDEVGRRLSSTNPAAAP
jgi:hypothetical protein